MIAMMIPALIAATELRAVSARSDFQSSKPYQTMN